MKINTKKILDARANKHLSSSERKQRQLELATDGNREVALDVLQEFVVAVKSNKAPDEVLMRYIAACFESILNGEKPDVALHVKKTKGHPRLSEYDLMNIALEVELDARYNVSRTGKRSITEAKLSVADGLYKGRNEYKTERSFKNQEKFETVRKAYEKYKILVSEMADEMGY